MQLATWLRAQVLCLAVAHYHCHNQEVFQPHSSGPHTNASTALHTRVQYGSNHAAYRPRHYLQLRATPPEVAKHRHEGNYYQPQMQLQPGSQKFSAEPKLELQLPQPTATFAQSVWHVEHVAQPQVDASQRRYTATALQSPLDEATSRSTAERATATPHSGSNRPYEAKANITVPMAATTRAYHDIFQRYVGPQQLSYGHVERRPALFEQRFATQDKGNRYRGEVIWADASGGYGEHRWDMAQGKLRR